MANQLLAIDQDLARRLFVEGAILVFLNVPPDTEFGIDLKSWNTGDKFNGVKMKPPGLHYVYYRLLPECGSICSVPEYVVVEETETPNQRRLSQPSTVKDILPQLKPQPEFALHLTPE